MQCPKCGARETCNVYIGVAMCRLCQGKPFMEPSPLIDSDYISFELAKP